MYLKSATNGIFFFLKEMLGETILLMKVTFDSRLQHEDRNEIS